MKIIEKLLNVAVIATICGFSIWSALDLFGNPLERKNVRNIADIYISENYSEIKPRIVDVDYDSKQRIYYVEVYSEIMCETFWLHYSMSGELEWDTYGYNPDI